MKVDPKHYKVELEIDRVRVVRIKYKAGEKSEDYIRCPLYISATKWFHAEHGQLQCRELKTQNAFYGTEGEARVSHIDIRDVAAVAVKALTEDAHAG